MRKIEFDFSKLQGRIIEKYGTRAKFAEAMGLKLGALLARLKNKTGWKDYEIHEASQLLEIDPTDIPLYFFAPKF